MKVKSLFLLFISFLALSCKNDNKELLAEQKKEIARNEVIYKNISNGWVFNNIPLEPKTQQLINNWKEWRNFVSEINEKPKSTIGAFQKKTTMLVKKVEEIKAFIQPDMNNPQVRMRIEVLLTKIKMLDLYIHLNPIPDKKIVKLVSEIDIEISFLKFQFEEIVERSLIPLEEGEADIIKMKDTARAIPDDLKELE